MILASPRLSGRVTRCLGCSTEGPHPVDKRWWANVHFWARCRLIGRADATGNSRAPQPFATSDRLGDVGPHEDNQTEVNRYTGFLCRYVRETGSEVSRLDELKTQLCTLRLRKNVV